jgi:HK97 family phage prohead protease
METKVVAQIEVKSEPAGEFTALVATFDKPDKTGDVIRPGAFRDTLADWRASGSKVPVVFSHEWSNPQMHIGECDPADLEETATGFQAKGRFYLDEANGRKVFTQLQRKALREWSFAFLITKSKQLARGAREILGLQLLEIGPCLSGVGTSATLTVKAAGVADVRRIVQRQAMRRAELAPVEAALAATSQRLSLARAEHDLAVYTRRRWQ